jgi:hypothetical protein
VGNGLVIGGLDDSDEIALPEHRVLRDHLAAEVGYLLVHLGTRALSTYRVLLEKHQNTKTGRRQPLPA